MLYTLTMGPVEQNIIKQAIRHGEPIPERIANAPELMLGLGLFFDAYFDLDSTRNVGMGFQRISWLNAKDYGLAHDYDEEQISDLLYFIPRMDMEYAKFLRSKRPTDGEPSRPSNET